MDPRELEPPANPAATLVVVIHGLRGSADRMRDVIAAACAAYGPQTVIYAPDLPHARWMSGTRAGAIIKTLLAGIDARVRETAPARIVLVGHSVGATLARRLFLVAIGWPSNFHREDIFADVEPRAWAVRVERIVMLAAFNRGWKISMRMSWRYAILFNLIGLIGHLIPTRAGWTPTAFDFRLGASFMAQTRLHWLAYRRNPPEHLVGEHRPILIQMLGTQDDLISPVDQVDLAVDGSRWAYLDVKRANAGGPADQDYFLVSLPRTDHKQAIVLQGDGAAGERGDRFRQALTCDRLALAVLALDPALLVDEIDAVDDSVENTVFVIHGIRDDGYWTHRIAQAVRERGGRSKDGTTVFRSWTPSYGYFAMLPFVLPWIRREKVEWFADQYVTAFARHPRSDFHYIGHSNGTYLAARALLDYPAIHFRHILFAGSVVRCDFPWTRLVREGRVVAFQNLVAGGDCVVALLPKSVDWIRAFDLGGAGFDGFDAARIEQRARRDKHGTPLAIDEVRYLRGGHGAGVSEEHWDRIAAFIVAGTPFPPSAGPVQDLYEAKPDAIPAVLGRLRIGLPFVVLVGLVVCWLGTMLAGPFGALVAILLIRFIVLRV